MFEVHKQVFVSFSAWDLCRVQRSRRKDVHWPTQLSTRAPPGPATRASGLRQRSADAAHRRNVKKAKTGFGPLVTGDSQQSALEAPSGGGSEEFALRAPTGGVMANCAGGSQRPLQRLLAGPDLVELAGLAGLAG